MTFKFNHELRGGHVHIAVFSGKDRDHLGKCGDLVMRDDEWLEFQETIPAGEWALRYQNNNQFIFEDLAAPSPPTALIYPTQGSVR